jgi:hypothetical protein
MGVARQHATPSQFLPSRRDPLTPPAREFSRLCYASIPGTLRAMARTNAQKRAQALAAGRARQERRRDRMAALGKPQSVRVDSALVEAMAFEIAREVLDGARADAHISASDLIETALSILVDRQGYDRRQSKLAIATRMSLRDEHRDPSFIPSLRPDPTAQAARAEIQSN